LTQRSKTKSDLFDLWFKLPSTSTCLTSQS